LIGRYNIYRHPTIQHSNMSNPNKASPTAPNPHPSQTQAGPRSQNPRPSESGQQSTSVSTRRDLQTNAGSSAVEPKSISPVVQRGTDGE
jgi:hypothetical protein